LTQFAENIRCPTLWLFSPS